MKQISWNAEKNRILMQNRGVSFEDALYSLRHGDVLDDIRHPNVKKYPHQNIFVLGIDGYAYLVPYVENEDEIFMKSIIPSRKATNNIWENIMNETKLDREEKAFVDAFESSEWGSALNEERKAFLSSCAEETMKRDQRIEVNVSRGDLSGNVPMIVKT